MSGWQEEWQEKALTLSAAFFPEVRAAFAFLEADYAYRLIEERITSPEDYRDTQAEVIYAGEQMGVMVYWYFSPGIVNVAFRKLHAPWQYPDDLSEEERHAGLPPAMSLYSLARFLGTAQDPDFMLGDMWNVYESKCKKRDALITGNMFSILAGLARATERYASAILEGYTSQFAEVRAFQEAHRDDYWERTRK